MADAAATDGNGDSRQGIQSVEIGSKVLFSLAQAVAPLTLNELARYANLRQKAEKAVGRDIPGAGNLAKLSMSRILRLSRDLGLQILGPMGTLHAYGTDARKALDDATGNPLLAMVTELALFSPGPSIYGGTDEIQHNIIGERVLGLPKEPGPAKDTPYRELPKNG